MSKFDKKCSKCKNYNGNILICESCAHYKPKPTVFEHITESEEALAEKMVFLKAVTYSFNAKDNTNYTEQWISTICNDVYPSKHEAFVATVEELKKEYINEN